METLEPDKPATATVEPDPDVPGQYKVNLGIPQGKTGEVPIDDTTTSTEKVWSSQKISDTLKLTADVAVTLITALASGVTQVAIESGGYSHYQVVNGVCYFQLYIKVLSSVSEYFTVLTGLPKPKAQLNLYFSATQYIGTSAVPFRSNISSNGDMQISGGAVGSSYMITGSYPVA